MSFPSTSTAPITPDGYLSNVSSPLSVKSNTSSGISSPAMRRIRKGEMGNQSTSPQSDFSRKMSKFQNEPSVRVLCKDVENEIRFLEKRTISQNQEIRKLERSIESLMIQLSEAKEERERERNQYREQLKKLQKKNDQLARSGTLVERNYLQVISKMKGQMVKDKDGTAKAVREELDVIIQNLRSEKSILRGEIKSWMDKSKVWEAKSNEHAQEKGLMERTFHEYQKKLEDSAVHIRDDESRLEVEKKRAVERDEEIKDQKAEIHRLQNVVDEWVTKWAQEQVRVTKLEKKMKSDLHERFEEWKSEKTRLQKKLDGTSEESEQVVWKHQEEIRNLTEMWEGKLSEQREEVLRDFGKQMKEEKVRWEEEYKRERGALLAETEKKLEESKKEKDKSEREVSDLQSALNSQVRQVRGREDQIQTLQIELEREKQNSILLKNKLSSKLEVLSAKMVEREKYEELEETNSKIGEKLRETVAQHEQESLEMKKMVSSLQKKHEEYVESIEVLKRQISCVQEEKSASESETSEWKDKFDESEQTTESLKRELDEQRSSSDQKISDIQKSSQDAMEKLLLTHKSELSDLKRQFEETLLEKDDEIRIAKLTLHSLESKRGTEIEKIHREYEKRREMGEKKENEMQQKFNEKLAEFERRTEMGEKREIEMQQKFDEKLAEFERRKSEELRAAKLEHSGSLTVLEKREAGKIEMMRKEHVLVVESLEQEMKEAQDEKEREIQSKDGEIERMKKKMGQLRKEADAQTKSREGMFKAQLEDLTRAHRDGTEKLKLLHEEEIHQLRTGSETATESLLESHKKAILEKKNAHENEMKSVIAKRAELTRALASRDEELSNTRKQMADLQCDYDQKLRKLKSKTTSLISKSTTQMKQMQIYESQIDRYSLQNEQLLEKLEECESAALKFSGEERKEEQKRLEQMILENNLILKEGSEKVSKEYDQLKTLISKIKSPHQEEESKEEKVRILPSHPPVYQEKEQEDKNEMIQILEKRVKKLEQRFSKKQEERQKRKDLERAKLEMMKQEVEILKRGLQKQQRMKKGILKTIQKCNNNNSISTSSTTTTQEKDIIIKKSTEQQQQQQKLNYFLDKNKQKEIFERVNEQIGYLDRQAYDVLRTKNEKNYHILEKVLLFDDSSEKNNELLSFHPSNKKKNKKKRRRRRNRNILLQKKNNYREQDDDEEEKKILKKYVIDDDDDVTSQQQQHPIFDDLSSFYNSSDDDVEEDGRTTTTTRRRRRRLSLSSYGSDDKDDLRSINNILMELDMHGKKKNEEDEYSSINDDEEDEDIVSSGRSNRNNNY